MFTRLHHSTVSSKPSRESRYIRKLSCQKKPFRLSPLASGSNAVYTLASCFSLLYPTPVSITGMVMVKDFSIPVVPEIVAGTPLLSNVTLKNGEEIKFAVLMSCKTQEAHEQ
eukprot:scaffold3079_cov174-Amphora_coffeaeformis.AAC.3